MKLRNKIILYFSASTILMLGLGLSIIGYSFAEYRQNEFYRLLIDRTQTNFKFLVEIKQIDEHVLKMMNKHTINNLYEEKVLFFNQNRELIYSSVDDTKILFPSELLKSLSRENPLIETEEDGFEIIGLYFTQGNEVYYGIAKAYDRYGKDKLSYLRIMLLATFLTCSGISILASRFLSKQLSSTLTIITQEIASIDIENKVKSSITIPRAKDEIQLLAIRFNDLLKRLSDSFTFQKHFTHHVSHELKTPIAVLLSNLELLDKEQDVTQIKKALEDQKVGLKELANIINSLLEISKSEAGLKQNMLQTVRLDELLFDVAEELNFLHDKVCFEFNISDKITDDKALHITGNSSLLKSAFQNLARNALLYSHSRMPLISVYEEDNKLYINFLNDGDIVSDAERTYLFTHFFRGKNSHTIKGAGLGLVLTNRIIELHNGTLGYTITKEGLNCFSVSFSV